MLEAVLQEAVLFKKLLDAIKELVTDANFECNEEAINLQAMDNSHVALVSVKLQASGFNKYRCDRPMPLGINLGSLTKVLKCAKDDDILTLKAADEADVLNLVYEARNSDRIAEYEMKLMEIDADTLGIPETEYEARVTMPSGEFARIVRDLSQLGESVRIEVSKEGVRFTSEGEAANGNVLLKQTEGPIQGGLIVAKKTEGDSEEVKDESDADEDGDVKVKKEKKVKVKKEKKDDEDVDMDEDEEEEFKPQVSDDEGEEEVDPTEDEDEEVDSKKRKKKSNSSSKPAKKAKTSSSKKKGKGKASDDDDDEDPTSVKIELNSHVSLTFSLKYLVNFAKSSMLSKKVQLMMSNDVPLLVSYDFGQGFIRYYLAPKIGDD